MIFGPSGEESSPDGPIHGALYHEAKPVHRDPA